MIRQAIINDAKAIAHIRVDGWKAAYRGLIPDSFLDSLDYKENEDIMLKRIDGSDDKFSCDILVYEQENEVVAFAYYGKALDYDKYPQYQSEVVALYVRPDKKGLGIGTQLMKEMKLLLKKQGCSNMIVWCLKGNTSSIKFYEHLGGVIKEEREYIVDGVKVLEVGIVYDL